MIHHGDCIEVMAGMPEASVDAIVTDPPYGLEFMGKEWDSIGVDRRQPGDPTFHPSGVGPFDRSKVRYGYGEGIGVRQQEWHERWAVAALRVAKPGAYLLAFGGTRTVHRMTVALEDAGWIIRDMLVWGYASGFPKSRALLKPAWEPIVMARKPGPLRDLDIDGCRIGTEPSGWNGLARTGQPEAADILSRSSSNKSVCRCGHHPISHPLGTFSSPDEQRCVVGACECERLEVVTAGREHAAGRWPANVVLTDPIFDGGIEGVVGGGSSRDGVAVRHRGVVNESPGWGNVGTHPPGTPDLGYGGEGGISRFFLIPKAARSDREPVLPGMLEEGEYTRSNGARAALSRGEDYRDDSFNRVVKRRNVHPTVKPTELMRHLVRLVTPADGTVLDPFLGSGTTALAAEQEGRAWIGIEREAEYVAIAEARLAGNQRGLGLSA